MAANTFSESELEFTFPEDWVVHRFDEHRFYRYVSGSGLKGVDFIAIHQGELILIEVKNYATRYQKKNHDPMESLLSHPASYVKEYLRKFEDSLRLLEVIHQYYNRKWWYRKLFQPFKAYFSENWIMKREIGFWSKAIEISQQRERVKLILWLELAPDVELVASKKLFAYFQKEIQAKVPEGMEFILAHSIKSYGGINVKIGKA